MSMTSLLWITLLAIASAFAETHPRPPVCRGILDHEDRVIDYDCPSGKVRVWVPLGEIDKKLRDTVVFLEDAKFYSHNGLDAEGIVDALQTDIKLGRFARGGSTITQQLAKNLYLSREKSLMRKISEVPLALQLERDLTKSQILELYLNTIEWGPGVYGAQAASRLYFDHDVEHLTLNEAWLLALMIPNPKELNLWVKPAGRKSLLKRARNLASRWRGEKKLARGADKQLYADFVVFLNQWEKKKPSSRWAEGRRYPAAWQFTAGISDIEAWRRGVRSKKGNSPLKTKLRWVDQTGLAMTAGAAVTKNPKTCWILKDETGAPTALIPAAHPPTADYSNLESLNPQRVSFDSFVRSQ